MGEGGRNEVAGRPTHTTHTAVASIADYLSMFISDWCSDPSVLHFEELLLLFKLHPVFVFTVNCSELCHREGQVLVDTHLSGNLRFVAFVPRSSRTCKIAYKDSSLLPQ